ncbi:hypothetical protein CKO42_16980 [Lamprobacter modestohalophilus]|uniref:DUF1841 family protein n=1 Tax=Lamprobacter modestohalophilus TaxID=1064514 RepID=A0A9X0WAZ9_9GAMM|nr:DUF1841 family protein [Lamprobacter modestohalophilus]MBK1620104.1 hypothetical protein [Lamprobacter modestohalophilus]
MFSQDRDQLRQAYLTAWRKAQADEPLKPVERQIVEVAGQHPEYHALLEQGEAAIGREWLPEGGESNPFLHMALHIALQEQVSTDRPAGIQRLYQGMIRHCLGDVHEAEHRILECLAEEIWKIQRHGREFRPKSYLKCIKRRGAGGRARD